MVGGKTAAKPFEGTSTEWTIRIENQKDSLLNQCRHGFPPQSPYLGFSTPTLCYINKLETRNALLKEVRLYCFIYTVVLQMLVSVNWVLFEFLLTD